MKRIVIYGFTMGLLLIQSSCTNITLLRTQELREVQSHVDSLKAEMAALQEEIIKEQKQQSEMLRLIRADQQVRFEEFDRRLAALAGNISESQDRLSQIDRKTLEIKKRWEEKAREDSLTQYAVDAEIENLYKIALSDFTAGRYDVAMSGFKDLINKFPESQQAKESHYWLPECNYVQKKYKDAAEGYKNYIKNFNNGSKVCVALYKLGLIYEKMKKKKSCDMVWNKLITQCPDSEEAEAAKARM